MNEWRSVFPESDRLVYDLYRRKERAVPDLARSCLLVVDVTEAFLGPRLPTLEAARQSRTACGLAGWERLPTIRSLQDAFRTRALPVVFAKPLWAGEAHVGGTTAGAAVDTRNDPIPLEIAPDPEEFVVVKSKASAFFGTALPSYFIRNRINTVVLAGSTTSGCVRSTAVDASSYGLDVVVVSDAVFDRSVLSHRVALYELDVKYASVLAAADVHASLGGQP